MGRILQWRPPSTAPPQTPPGRGQPPSTSGGQLPDAKPLKAPDFGPGWPQKRKGGAA